MGILPHFTYYCSDNARSALETGRPVRFPAASMCFVVPNKQPAPVPYRHLCHPVRFTLAGDDFDVLDIFVVKPRLAHAHKFAPVVT